MLTRRNGRSQTATHECFMDSTAVFGPVRIFQHRAKTALRDVSHRGRSWAPRFRRVLHPGVGAGPSCIGLDVALRGASWTSSRSSITSSRIQRQRRWGRASPDARHDGRSSEAAAAARAARCAPTLRESPLRSPFPVACALAIIRPLWGAANPMQCHECDAVLPPEARFCFSCGARLEPDAPESTVDALLETLKKAIG